MFQQPMQLPIYNINDKIIEKIFLRMLKTVNVPCPV